MFSLGGDPNPKPKTVLFLIAHLVRYRTYECHSALDRARPTGNVVENQHPVFRR